MLDKIRLALDNHPNVHAWKVIESETRGTQLYTTFGRTEAVRETERKGFTIQVITRNGHNGRSNQGSFSFEIPEGEKHLEDKINFAAAQAILQNNEQFDLPLPGQNFEPFNDADPQIKSQPVKLALSLHEELQDALNHYKRISIPGSEFFLSFLKQRLINSNGLDVCSEHTDLLWDVVLFCRDNDIESEFWTMYHRAGSQYFTLKNDFRQFASFAHDAMAPSIPNSGDCPVIITGDALHVLFQFFLYHSSAMARYNGSALFKPGENVLTDKPVGDLFTLYSNALHPGGIHSYKFDQDGIPGQRTRIIHNGILEQYWSTKQYADYLKINPTGEFANIEIPPGSTPWEKLLQHQDRVIQVVQFSTFDPSPVDGNYMGEIRVGYEYKPNGSVTPLRGGSVSGNVATGMLNCRFSSEMETFYGYHGPRGVRFESAQVAGK